MILFFIIFKSINQPWPRCARVTVWVLGVGFVIALTGIALMYQRLQMLERSNNHLLDYWGDAVLSDPAIDTISTDAH